MRRSYRRNKSCGVLIWKEEEAEERTGNVRADRSPQVNSTDPFSDTLACQSRKNTAGIKSINDSRIPFRWAGSRARLLAWNGTGPTLMLIFTPGLLRLQPMTTWRMDGVTVTSSKLLISNHRGRHLTVTSQNVVNCYKKKGLSWHAVTWYGPHVVRLFQFFWMDTS